MANNIYYDPSRYRYMPEDKPAGVAAMQDWLSGLNKDQFNQALQKYLEVADTSQGYGSIWKNNPNYAWEQFQKNPVQVATPFWQGTPKGNWWQEHAGLGPSPGKITDWDKLFSTGVTAALALAGGAAGGALLGPTLGAATGAGIGAGATGGFVGGTYNDNPLGGMLEGAAKGGAAGWAGGQIAQGIGNTVGYNPVIADATWSSTATPISQLGAQAGQAALTGAGQGAFQSAIGGGNIFEGALKGGVSGGVNTGLSGGMTSTFGTGEGGAWDKLLSTGGKALGSTLTSNLWSNAPTSRQQTFGIQPTSGGNMALGDLSLGQIGGAVSPFLSAWNTQQQRGQTRDVYDQAMNLITQPSPDQQRYRTQLQTLMESPGSMQSSPLYNSMLESGMNAVNRTAAAKGMLGSGSRLADLMKSGQQTAAQYYFPQQQALASLSGVPQDTAQRTLGAQSLISGNTANMGLTNQMLGSLMEGAGVKSPQQQMIDALLGKTGGDASGLGGLTVGAVKDWFSGTPDMGGQTSPVFTDNMGWENVFSGYNPATNYESPNIDLGANLGGTQSEYLQSLLNQPSYDYNQSWF